MSQKENKFSFELNETLYFSNGNEVAEMMQISLDPDISIQPFDDYISIRGVIELQGEYRKADDGNTEADHSRQDDGQMRFMDHVSDTAEAEAIFTHGFPVEISVPAYRVEDVTDISVTIGSFDYEIPERNQLKLQSVIDIYGIRMEEAQQDDTQTEEVLPDEETVQELPAETSEVERQIDEAEADSDPDHSAEPEQADQDNIPYQDEIKSESLDRETEDATLHSAEQKTEEIDETRFQFDIKDAKPSETVEDTSSVEQPESVAASEQRESVPQENNTLQSDITEPASVPAEQAEDEHETRLEGMQPQASEESDKDHEETSEPQADEEEPVAEQEEEKERWKNKKSQTLAEFFKSNPSSNYTEVTEIEDPPTEPFPSSSHLDFELSSSSYESVESRSEAADVSYLADMFRNEEEEQQFTKLRLCIVQEQDTVESIAERYQIPTLQILKQNELDADNLTEGQLLYIPAQNKN